MRPYTLLLALLGLAACHDPSPASGGSTGSSRAESRFFLPSGVPGAQDVTNTSAPTVTTDGRGGIHTLYPSFFGGGAFYSYCAGDCEGPRSFPGVHFDTEGTVDDAMLVLDADGHPRVLLSAYAKILYASCDRDCAESSSWRVTEVLDHGAKSSISGRAFALDPQGRPRFLMHTSLALSGIGSNVPRTEYVVCDDDCHDPSSWHVHPLADQIWERSELRFDAQGRAHVATVAHVEGPDTFRLTGAYIACDGDCTDPDRWNSVALGEAFVSSMSAVTVNPSIALDLTSAGQPRIALLARNTPGRRASRSSRRSDRRSRRRPGSASGRRAEGGDTTHPRRAQGAGVAFGFARRSVVVAWRVSLSSLAWA